MEITQTSTKSYTTLTGTLPSGKRAEVTVYHYDDEAPQVNWSAIGSVAPADAAAYGTLIIAASAAASMVR